MSAMFGQWVVVGRRRVEGWRGWEGYDLACGEMEALEAVYARLRGRAGRLGLGVVALMELDPVARREYKRAGEAQRRVERRGARYTPEGLARKRLRNAQAIAELRARYLAQRAVWVAQGNTDPFVALRVWRRPGPLQFKARASAEAIHRWRSL